MPIRGITDRVRMPRLGKIHLGVKVQGTRGEYPSQTDHFVCPPEVTEALRDKVRFCACPEAGPIELPITFVTSDTQAVADQWYRSYKATVGLVCKGDGERADALFDTAELKKAGGDVSQPIPVTRWAKHNSAQVVRRPCDCWGQGYEGTSACPAFESGACKQLMLLQFAMPAVAGLGVWQLDTSSYFSMMNVNGFLQYLEVITGGRFAGVPLRLKLIAQEVAPEGKKKTVRVLQLDTDLKLEQVALAARRPIVEALLPPPDEAEAPTEFFPEQAANGEAEAVAEADPLMTPEPAPEQPTEGDEPELKNIGDLYEAARQRLGYKGEADILSTLGYSKRTEIGDLGAAWETLKAAARG